ncbi:hypothetical protein J437_LFUL016924 [Ladona fulva]|uniref:Uncharacterized protein n=1 Tax=Ladona fulva TaxID=123851 RepID=A0A8K0KPM2_LADFU|nr:hypothetical protein J437_LFUL016924 [Ladona fulva]
MALYASVRKEEVRKRWAGEGGEQVREGERRDGDLAGVCSILLVATVVAGMARAGFFAAPLPLLRTPRVYNIIVRSDGSLLPSAAYSLPLDHPIFHPSAPPKAAAAKDGDSEQPAPAESGTDAPATSSPAPHHPAPPALPITHVAVNFPGRAANSSSEHTVVATTLPFYSLYHPLAFPIPDPTPFIHPFGPHPGPYFFAPAVLPPGAAVERTAGGVPKAPAAAQPKEEEKEEAKEEKKEEAER